ncbi:MAG: hypothetical protein ACK504_01800 [Bacteroidota bacterium]
MNIESIKAELEEVLKNDVILRKDFNQVKRSLSDYRNQLIQRDEDCKRLEVSIDVLNTKLVVMERDNSSLKNEITFFRDLKNTIAEQLTEKQNEINELHLTIENLESQLANISFEHEIKTEELKLNSNHEISTLKSLHEDQIKELKSNKFSAQDNLIIELETKIFELTNSFDVAKQEIISSYEAKIEELKNQFNSQIDNLKTESNLQIENFDASTSETISSLTQSYELQISELNNKWENEKAELLSVHEAQLLELNNSLQEHQSNFENEINFSLNKINALFAEKENELTVAHQEEIAKIISESEVSIENLKLEYDIKLSHAVLHSNSQNSKLTEDLSKALAENEAFKDNQNAIQELNAIIEEQKNQISDLTNHCSTLNHSVDDLNELLLNEKQTIDQFISELELNHQEALENQKLEFNKLLIENTSLISEIEIVSDKLSVTESAALLLKDEISEFKSISEAKVFELKETLTAKNFELTHLAASNSAFQTEMDYLKIELEEKNNQLKTLNTKEEKIDSLQLELDAAIANRLDLEHQLTSLQLSITELNNQIETFTTKIADYEVEISNLKSTTKSDEKDSFIDRLFLQIDALTDERLTLLNEKEEMVNQLLKMNESISILSQHVDYQNFDISALDSHRKNVILSKSLSNEGSEETILKKQINELVREIDKCISLLSA